MRQIAFVLIFALLVSAENALAVQLGQGRGEYFPGNVGIGTTDPQGLLDVRGSLCLNGGADCRTTWPTSGDLGSVDGSGTTNYLPKFSDADTLANSAIFESAGNVGIGTTSPGAKLTVDSGNVKINTANYGLEMDGNKMFYRNTSDGHFYFQNPS